MLVCLERWVSPFPLWQRRPLFVAADSWNRPGGFTRCSFRFVFVAHNRGTSFLQFSMGRAFAGGGFFIDLFRAMAPLAAGVATVATTTTCGYGLTRFADRFVFAQAAFVQTDADVRGSEANQRRR